MVIVCLTAQRRPEGLPLETCAKLILLVALSGAFALFAVLVPFGPQLAASRASTLREAAWKIVQLNVEKTLTAFLETDSRRQHITVVQLAELSRSARNSASQFAACLEDARWEPKWPCCRDSLPRLHNDLGVLEKILDLVDAVQRTLLNLPLNMCHMAFADRLKPSLFDLTVEICAHIANPSTSSEADSEIKHALLRLHNDYTQARRDLLYPEKPNPVLSSGLTLSIVSWTTKDLLHMNTFLFATMHLAAHVSSHRCSSGQSKSTKSVRRAAWISYAAGFTQNFRLRWPLNMDLKRLRSAARFAVAIVLAAILCLAPSMTEYFEQEIWAPVEVTFLMFKYGGGSLRQSLLRLQGALLGSVVGYIIVLMFGMHHYAWVVACLALWSFAAGLIRSSIEHGYAASVASWTAVIVATTGIVAKSQGMNAQVPALERMTHTVVGVASLVLAVAVVFPSWASDAANQEMVSLFSGFEELYDTLQQAWVESSQQMRADLGNGDMDEVAALTDEAVVTPVDMKTQEKLFVGLKKKLTMFKVLVEEAAVEPAMWRHPYQAAPSRNVARLLDELLCWLRMFGMCLAFMSDGGSPILRQVFNGQKPKQWLSEEWVNHLQCTNKNITGMLCALRNALENSQFAGDTVSPQEQPYLNAICVERWEASMRQELGGFVQCYNSILNCAISDSQLKIHAGQQTDPLLTSMDMLLYNSLVFATQGFSEELLKCSRGVRDLVLLNVGIEDAADISEIQALAAPPSLLEKPLSKINIQVSMPSPSSDAPRKSRSTLSRTSTRQISLPETLEHADVLPLVFSIAGSHRDGIVSDVLRTVLHHGGSVGSSRMAKLDNDFVFLVHITATQTIAKVLEEDLRAVLKGLQISAKVARDDVSKPPPYQAEVCFLCPRDAPGLLMRLTSVFDESGLDILTLDTTLQPTLGGFGFLVVARVGASAPIAESLLTERLSPIQAGANITIKCFSSAGS